MNLRGTVVMRNEEPVREGPEPDEIRRALEVVLASEMFRSSPQLGAFLRYVVEATLRGESERLKGYTIGVEALGRSERFDAQIDPIVRVEATRLRRTLGRYYAGPGAADPIVFELPRGGYIPAIRRRHAADSRAAPTQAASDSPRRWPRPRPWQVTLAVASLIAVTIVAVIALRHQADEAGRVEATVERSGGPAFDGPLQPGNGKPTLTIPPIPILGARTAPGAPRPHRSFEPSLTEKLRVALARFDTLNVVGSPSEESASPASRASPEAMADYRLIGSGEFLEDGSVTGRVRLVDVAENTVVWSRTLGPFGPTTDFAAIEDAIVSQLATTLPGPFGVIYANERRKQIATGAGDPRYRCLVEAAESFRSFDPVQHRRARACLELLTVRDRGFATGFAYLAAIYLREYRIFAVARNDVSLLDRALRSVRQAIELEPQSARGYHVMLNVLAFSGDLAAGLAAGEKAVALNPYDMLIVGDFGGNLVFNGETERGVAILMRATEPGTVLPSWYNLYLFLACYLGNDTAGASRHAGQITTNTYPLGLLARTLVAVANGNPELARKTYEQLVALRADWRDHPREEIARLIPSSAIVDRLANDLAKAGLVPSR